MHAPPSAYPSMLCQDAERRREQREPRRTTASVWVAGQCPAEAWLTDVSIYGCCVQTAVEWMRPGRCLAIGLAGGQTLNVIVRWSRAGHAGLELLQPVTADQLEWLALID